MSEPGRRIVFKTVRRTSAGIVGVRPGSGIHPHADQFPLRNGGPSAGYVNPRCRLGGGTLAVLGARLLCITDDRCDLRRHTAEVWCTRSVPRGRQVTLNARFCPVDFTASRLARAGMLRLNHGLPPSADLHICTLCAAPNRTCPLPLEAGWWGNDGSPRGPPGTDSRLEHCRHTRRTSKALRGALAAGLPAPAAALPVVGRKGKPARAELLSGQGDRSVRSR